MGFVKLIVFGFLFLSVIYLSISVYSRSVRREKLEKEFDANPPEGADEAMRDTYIEQGMVEYNSGIRPRLIALVYVVPFCVISAIIYIINAN